MFEIETEGVSESQIQALKNLCGDVKPNLRKAAGDCADHLGGAIIPDVFNPLDILVVYEHTSLDI